MTNRFRATMSVHGLHNLATNFGTMGALMDQFVHETSPQLARKLHMTPGEFDAYVKQQFPAVAAGVRVARAGQARPRLSLRHEP